MSRACRLSTIQPVCEYASMSPCPARAVFAWEIVAATGHTDRDPLKPKATVVTLADRCELPL